MGKEEKNPSGADVTRSRKRSLSVSKGKTVQKFIHTSSRSLFPKLFTPLFGEIFRVEE